MANFIGVIMSCLISASAIPLVIVITDHDILSQPINMMIIGFGFLASVVMVVYLVLPPTGIKKQLGKEGRGVLYYTCCVFMWASVADFTLQSRQLGIFGFASNSAYFDHGEPYLQTPFGIGVQYWNAVINFILYANIIYKIDNHIDPRFTAIYWAGGILTSQFCVLFGAYTGSYAAYLPPSVAMNVVFVVYPFWVFFHFINKPRAEKIPPTNDSKYRVLDVFLVVSLMIASFFMAIRGLGGFDSPFPLTQHYVTKYEPYILDPSKFGATWVLYGLIYGVPFQLFAIYGLLNQGCNWMLDLVVFYAAGMLQGTCVYLSYNWLPMSEPEYTIPNESFYFVLTANLFLVLVSNLLLLRCYLEPGYFVKDKQKMS